MIATQSIEPRNYYEPTVSETEQKAIFHSYWNFVGFKGQLANNNDFVTKIIGGTPVVIQNFHGELHALLNICSHRKAKLQVEANGNRRLCCPYHCWSYKAEGKLAGIPQNKSDFGIDDVTKKKLALKNFDISYCGDFIFVRINKEGESLKKFLGPYFDILFELSDSFTDPVHSGVFHWNTNWKLAVETVLEVYHVAGTHPESFAKLAKPECEIDSYPPHTTGNTPLTDTTKKWWKGVRKRLNLQQNENYTEYNHFFIYPNLAIGLTNGSLMSVQTYEPSGSMQCSLNFNLRMIAGIEGKKTNKIVKSAVKKNFTEFNYTTLEEDRVVAESCQQNMPHTEVPSLLGLCEDRIRYFHKAWCWDMGLDNEKS